MRTLLPFVLSALVPAAFGQSFTNGVGQLPTSPGSNNCPRTAPASIANDCAAECRISLAAMSPLPAASLTSGANRATRARGHSTL